MAPGCPVLVLVQAQAQELTPMSAHHQVRWQAQAQVPVPPSAHQRVQQRALAHLTKRKEAAWLQAAPA